MCNLTHIQLQVTFNYVLRVLRIFRVFNFRTVCWHRNFLKLKVFWITAIYTYLLTVITLFLSWKYFQTALVIRKFVTRILFRYEEFILCNFLLFYYSVDGQRSFLLLIMATAYLTLALVGFVECVDALQQPLHIYLCTHDTL